MRSYSNSLSDIVCPTQNEMRLGCVKFQGFEVMHRVSRSVLCVECAGCGMCWVWKLHGKRNERILLQIAICLASGEEAYSADMMNSLLFLSGCIQCMWDPMHANFPILQARGKGDSFSNTDFVGLSSPVFYNSRAL